MEAPTPLAFDQSRFIDRRFYRLTVIGFERSKYGATDCVCRCECGKEVSASPHDLKHGRVKSCGCLNDELKARRNAESQKKRAAEFIGKRFGRLLVLEVVKREGYSNKSVCVCRCDCGGSKDAFYSDLTTGRVKSCGCLANPLGNLSEEERREHGRALARKNTRKYRETHPYEWKPLTPEQRERDRQWRIANKEKYLAAIKKWEEAHPEKKREYQLVSRCRKFGITAEQYNAAMDRQGGGCAICGGQNPKGAGVQMLAIDHNHQHCPGAFGCTECFRGLLCDPCNRGLGAFKDSIDRLQSAIDYLKKWQFKPTEVAS